MSSFWNFAFGALLVLIWIVAGGFVTQANVKLHSTKDKDSDLNKAYWYTFWAAFITWFLVGIFILLIILSVLGIVALFGSGVGEAGAAAEGGAVAAEGAEGAETAEAAEAEEGAAGRSRKANEAAKSPQGQSAVSTGVSWLTIAFLVFALILVAITGVLSALAAASMIRSPNYDPSNANLRTAYTDCIIAASMCLGAGGLLIIGIIVYFIIGEQHKKKIEAQQKLEQKEHALELQELQQERATQIQEIQQEKATAYQQAYQQRLNALAAQAAAKYLPAST